MTSRAPFELDCQQAPPPPCAGLSLLFPAATHARSSILRPTRLEVGIPFCHFSSSIFARSAASRTVSFDRSSTIFCRSAIGSRNTFPQSGNCPIPTPMPRPPSPLPPRQLETKFLTHPCALTSIPQIHRHCWTLAPTKPHTRCVSGGSCVKRPVAGTNGEAPDFGRGLLLF